MKKKTPIYIDAARETLRAFAAMCDTTNPATVAAAITDVERANRTLVRVRKLQLWLKKYVQAIYTKQL
jgi:hypothetical protein